MRRQRWRLHDGRVVVGGDATSLVLDHTSDLSHFTLVHGGLDEQLVDVVRHVEDLVLDDTSLLDHLDLVAVHVKVVLVLGLLELMKADLQIEVGLVDVLLLDLDLNSPWVENRIGHVRHLSILMTDTLPQVGCEANLVLRLEEPAAPMHAGQSWGHLFAFAEEVQEVRSEGRICLLQHLVVALLGEVEAEALADRVDGDPRDRNPLQRVLLIFLQLEGLRHNQYHQRDHEGSKQSREHADDLARVGLRLQVTVADSRHGNDNDVHLREVLGLDQVHIVELRILCETDLKDAQHKCQYKHRGDQHSRHCRLWIIDEARLEDEAEARVEIVVLADVATVRV